MKHILRIVIFVVAPTTLVLGVGLLAAKGPHVLFPAERVVPVGKLTISTPTDNVTVGPNATPFPIPNARVIKLQDHDSSSTVQLFIAIDNVNTALPVGVSLAPSNKDKWIAEACDADSTQLICLPSNLVSGALTSGPIAIGIATTSQSDATSPNDERTQNNAVPLGNMTCPGNPGCVRGIINLPNLEMPKVNAHLGDDEIERIAQRVMELLLRPHTISPAQGAPK